MANLVTAKILSISAHPDAKKLRVCQIDDGSSASLTVVCGASNARVGMITILAQVGATLPSGVESEGMLCSAKELGVANETGLVDLPPTTQTGLPYTALKVADLSSTPAWKLQESTEELSATTHDEAPREEAPWRLGARTFWFEGQYQHRPFL